MVSRSLEQKKHLHSQVLFYVLFGMLGEEVSSDALSHVELVAFWGEVSLFEGRYLLLQAGMYSQGALSHVEFMAFRDGYSQGDCHLCLLGIWSFLFTFLYFMECAIQ